MLSFLVLGRAEPENKASLEGKDRLKGKQLIRYT